MSDLDDSGLNTDLRSRFWFMDPIAAATIPLLAVYPRFWTLAIVVIVIAFTVVLEWFGLRPGVLLAMCRIRMASMFAWPIKITRPRFYQRRLEDRW